MANPFERVALGSSGLSLTRFGLGTAALSWMYQQVTRSEAAATIGRAYALEYIPLV